VDCIPAVAKLINDQIAMKTDRATIPQGELSPDSQLWILQQQKSQSTTQESQSPQENQNLFEVKGPL
jgi:hypothetical protein